MKSKANTDVFKAKIKEIGRKETLEKLISCKNCEGELRSFHKIPFFRRKSEVTRRHCDTCGRYMMEKMKEEIPATEEDEMDEEITAIIAANEELQKNVLQNRKEFSCITGLEIIGENGKLVILLHAEQSFEEYETKKRIILDRYPSYPLKFVQDPHYRRAS